MVANSTAVSMRGPKPESGHRTFIACFLKMEKIRLKIINYDQLKKVKHNILSLLQSSK
jgi:hypothetical protein